MAQLEAASVHAFDAMAYELEGHGAPCALVEACLAAAGDERRHAAEMARLARKHGASMGATRAPMRRRRRSLAALARENAVEGCVRETFGALVNAWQVAHASDPDVRQTLAGIAEDELRHAALSWEIARWAETPLAPSVRREIARARRAAVGRLLAKIDRDVEQSLSAIAGLPSRRKARDLARNLAERLWLLAEKPNEAPGVAA
jgi:hypothetical protein